MVKNHLHHYLLGLLDRCHRRSSYKYPSYHLVEKQTRFYCFLSLDLFRYYLEQALMAYTSLRNKYINLSR